ncbi:MAG: permease prefix domain 1-containing protein [Cellulosilyticaceae bacterium]
MNKRIKEFIDQLFAHTPHTTYVEELKEEMLTNLCDKYEDLLVEGKSKDEAYMIVTASVGDIRELVSGIDESAVMITTKDLEARRKKSALITSIAVAMYILCGAIMVGMGVLGDYNPMAPVIGVVIVIIIVAGATGMLIYDNATKPEVLKDDYQAKVRKEAMSPAQKRNDTIKDAVSTVLWVGTVAVYLIINFVVRAWDYSWIIFIIAAAVQCIINLIFKLKE